MKRAVQTRTLLLFMILVAASALESRVAAIDQPRTLNLADVQHGLGNAEIKRITGTGSSFSLRITLENKNDYPVEIVCHEGAVIQSGSSDFAEMITLYPQTFRVDPGKVEEFGIETYCIEARKKTAENQTFFDKTIEPADNQHLTHLMRTIHQIEKNISTKILSIDGDSFTAEPMADALVPLAQSSQYFKSRQGEFIVKLNEQIVQFAIWQITDGVNMDELSEILKIDSDGAVEALKMIAQLSNVILEEARLQPSIQF